MATLSKPLPAIHGSCKWIGGAPTSAQLDLGAILEITVQTQKGEVTGLYLVRCERERDGKLLGYVLLKEESGEFTERHEIDCTFSRSLADATCSCGDATYRPGRPGGCKHLASIRAAIARVKA